MFNEDEFIEKLIKRMKEEGFTLSCVPVVISIPYHIATQNASVEKISTIEFNGIVNDDQVYDESLEEKCGFCLVRDFIVEKWKLFTGNKS